MRGAWSSVAHAALVVVTGTVLAVVIGAVLDRSRAVQAAQHDPVLAARWLTEAGQPLLGIAPWAWTALGAVGVTLIVGRLFLSLMLAGRRTGWKIGARVFGPLGLGFALLLGSTAQRGAGEDFARTEAALAAELRPTDPATLEAACAPAGDLVRVSAARMDGAERSCVFTTAGALTIPRAVLSGAPLALPPADLARECRRLVRGPAGVEIVALNRAVVTVQRSDYRMARDCVSQLSGIHLQGPGEDGVR